jgi:hypothetical protein
MSKRLQILSVCLSALIIHLALMANASNLSNDSLPDANFLKKIYANWHVDTDLQVQAKVLNLEGSNSFEGLGLVTSKNPSVNVYDLNRFNVDTSTLISTPYWSSSGLNAVLFNNLYFKFFKGLVAPTLFLFIVRAILLLLSVVGIFYFVSALSQHFSSLNTFLFVVVFIYSPWIFLDLTSFLWSPILRFMPFFYLAYLKQRKNNICRIGRKERFLLSVTLVISTFNGFELSGIIFASTLLVLFRNSSGTRIKRTWHSFSLICISVIFSFFSWFLILFSSFSNGSLALKVMLYNLFKHSSVGTLEQVPGITLQSSDENIKFFESLFRLLFRTSVLVPYDIVIKFNMDNFLINTLVNLFILFSSFGFVFMLMILKRKRVDKLLFAIVCFWIISIKSFAYHHVHILGTTLLIYLILIVFSSLEVKKKISLNNKNANIC